MDSLLFEKITKKGDDEGTFWARLKTKEHLDTTKSIQYKKIRTKAELKMSLKAVLSFHTWSLCPAGNERHLVGMIILGYTLFFKCFATFWKYFILKPLGQGQWPRVMMKVENDLGSLTLTHGLQEWMISKSCVSFEEECRSVSIVPRDGLPLKNETSANVSKNKPRP